MNKFIHISHNDLDGYASSFVVSNCVSNNVDYQQYNLDYSDVLKTVEEVVTHLNSIEQKSLLLITDLGLNEELFSLLMLLKDDVELRFVDHHVVKDDLIEDVENYSKESKNKHFLINRSRCATSLIHDEIVFLSNYRPEYFNYDNHILTKNGKFNDFLRFSQLVDYYDRWLREDQNAINFMSIFSDLVIKSKFIFTSTKQKFINEMFLHFVSAGVFYEYFELKKQTVDSDYNDLIQDIFNKVEIEIMKKKKELNKIKSSCLTAEQATILYEYDSFENLVFYNKKLNAEAVSFSVLANIDSTVFQNLSAEFLRLNKDGVNVIINLNEKEGTISFRSATEFANKFAVLLGGGGHPNAGGASTKLNAEELASFLEISIIR